MPPPTDETRLDPSGPTPEELGLAPPPSPEAAARRRLGSVLVGLGIGLIAWSALYLADAAQGGRARREFADRVSYDQAKVNVHSAFPGTVARGVGGLVLVGIGLRVRRRR